MVLQGGRNLVVVAALTLLIMYIFYIVVNLRVAPASPHAYVSRVVVALGNRVYSDLEWPEERKKGESTAPNIPDADAALLHLQQLGYNVQYARPSNPAFEDGITEVIMSIGNPRVPVMHLITNDFVRRDIDSDADSLRYLGVKVSADGFMFYRRKDALRWTAIQKKLVCAGATGKMPRQGVHHGYCMESHIAPHVHSGKCNVFSGDSCDQLVCTVEFDVYGIVSELGFPKEEQEIP
jgi:hypothetical protein